MSGGSHELEKIGVNLKVTSAMLKKGQSSSGSKTLFRRGSRRLSVEVVDAAMQAKHAEEIKKADHLRKKLKTHHSEARSALTKKLQVESTRQEHHLAAALMQSSNLRSVRDYPLQYDIYLYMLSVEAML